jgi:hypothetical protein
MKKIIIFTLSAMIFICLSIIVIGGFELFNSFIGGFGNVMAQTGKDLIALLKPLFIFGIIAGAPIYITLLILGLGKGSHAVAGSVMDLSEELLKAKRDRNAQGNP